MANLELTTKELKEVTVGINLGSSNFSVSCCINDTQRLLKNKDNETINPSYVFFNEKPQAMVGKYAKMMTDTLKPEYGVYDSLRLIGRKFDDIKIQEVLPYLSYQIENKSNELMILIKQPKRKVRRTPIQIFALILEKIRADVKDIFKKVKKIKAVITVPACFNSQQRRIILEAADKGGFKVLKLLNNTTAIAFHYLFQNQHLKTNDHFLVYDLGGGTFNVAVLKVIDGENLLTVALSGDSFLGGHDFDTLLLKHISTILLQKHDIDTKGDYKLLRQLRTKCEQAKKDLSYAGETEIILKDIISDVKVENIRITQKEFEEIVNGLIQKTLNIIKSLLKDKKISKLDVNKLLLCGGSSRIPQIRRLLSKLFGHADMSIFEDQDKVGAKGAALQAALFSNSDHQYIASMNIIDITPLSVGTEEKTGLMKLFMERNSTIPGCKTILFSKVLIEESFLTYDIYEGERANCKYNRYLTSVHLHNTIPGLPGSSEIMLTMTTDNNGIMSFYALQKVKKKRRELKVYFEESATKSDAHVKNSLLDAEFHQQEDKQFTKFANQKKQLMNYCHKVMLKLEKRRGERRLREVYDACGQTYDEANLLGLEDKDRLNNLDYEIRRYCDRCISIRYLT